MIIFSKKMKYKILKTTKNCKPKIIVHYKFELNQIVLFKKMILMKMDINISKMHLICIK